MKKNTFGMKISLTSEKWNETLIILNNNLSYSEVFYWQQLKKLNYSSHVFIMAQASRAVGHNAQYYTKRSTFVYQRD